MPTGKQGGEEHKDDGLNEPVKQVEVEAEHRRQHHRHQQLEHLHDDEGAQNVAEQAHTQRQGPDGHLHQVDGDEQRHGLGELLQAARQAVVAELGAVDEEHAHEGQGRRHADVLRGGCQAKDPDEVAQADVEGHRPQPGGEGPPVKCSPKVGQKLCGKAILNSVLDRT